MIQITKVIERAKACLKMMTPVHIQQIKNKFNLENMSAVEIYLDNGLGKRHGTLKS